jgi:hypothetical protein
MTAIAAELQQQVAVGFKGNPARGWQDANLTPMFARPKHVTCLYPTTETPDHQGRAVLSGYADGWRS